jgi:guanylate kinase
VATEERPIGIAEKTRPGKLVVISGPSGVGKSTIRQEVVRRTGATYSVSATTRPPRAGEADGRDYCFVDRRTFRRMIDNDELLEWAEVFGQLYGTPAAPVKQAVGLGLTVVLEIDVQGGLQVHRKMPEATFVLVLPPGEAELARRLAGRGSEDAAAAAARLAKAKEEIETAERSGAYKYRVVNDDIEQAVRRVVDIINEERSGK